MESKQVQIDQRNIDRQASLAEKFPPGLTTIQARINYALNLGLNFIANPSVSNVPSLACDTSVPAFEGKSNE